MSPVAEAVWQAWQFDPWALALILMPGVIYVGGWRQVHRQMPHRFGAARLAAFLAGLRPWSSPSPRRWMRSRTYC